MPRVFVCLVGVLTLMMPLATAQAATLQEAQQLLAHGQFDAALQAAEELLRAEPVGVQRLEMQLVRGAALVSLHRFAEAEEVLQPLAASAISATVREQAMYYFADNAYRQGDYAVAIARYQDIIAPHGTGRWQSLAQVGLGWAYYHQGQCQESFAAFEALRRSGPSGVLRGAELYALGDCARRLTRPTDAIDALQQILSDPLDPWNDEALLALTELFLTQRRFDEARATCAQGLRDFATSPLLPGFRLYAGQLALEAQDVVRAAEQFELVLTQHPESPHLVPALIGLGDVAFDTGRFDGAVTYYHRALLHAPQGPYAPYALCQQAHAVFNQGHWRTARLLYEQLLTQYPHTPWQAEARFRLGETWLADSNAAKAIEQFALIVQQAPQSPWAGQAQLAWADALFQAEQWEEAYRTYQLVVERYASQGELATKAAVRQALCLAARGNRDQARQELQALLTPTLPPAAATEVHLALVRFAIEEEDLATATQQLQAAEPLAHGSPLEADVLFWQGWLAFQQRQWEQALAAWERLQTQHPANPRVIESRSGWLLALLHVKGIEPALEALETLGQTRPREELLAVGRAVGTTLREEGLAQEAIQVYTFLTSRVPVAEQAEWLFLLGELHEELRRFEEAVTMYRRAMGQHPEEEIALRSAMAAARVLEHTERASEAIQLYRQVARSASRASLVALERLKELETTR